MPILKPFFNYTRRRSGISLHALPRDDAARAGRWHAQPRDRALGKYCARLPRQHRACRRAGVAGGGGGRGFVGPPRSAHNHNEFGMKKNTIIYRNIGPTLLF